MTISGSSGIADLFLRNARQDRGFGTENDELRDASVWVPIEPAGKFAVFIKESVWRIGNERVGFASQCRNQFVCGHADFQNTVFQFVVALKRFQIRGIEVNCDMS